MVSDAFGATADAGLYITVLCPSPPSAADAYYSMTVVMPYLDIQPVIGPAGYNLTIGLPDPPAFATATYNSVTQTFRYTPNGGACPAGKTDSFTYSVDDVYGQDTAYGVITVECLK